MNRESVPLVLAILIPLVLVTLMLLYNYGYDITSVIREFLIGIPPLYYIVVFPIALGFVVIIVKCVRPD